MNPFRLVRPARDAAAALVSRVRFFRADGTRVAASAGATQEGGCVTVSALLAHGAAPVVRVDRLGKQPRDDAGFLVGDLEDLDQLISCLTSVRTLMTLRGEDSLVADFTNLPRRTRATP